MKKISNGWLAAIVVLLVVVIDQITKIWVKTHFYMGETCEVTSWFEVQFIENNGMAFGMELGSKIFLTWFRIIAVGLFIYYLCKLRHRLDVPKGYIVCISLITAGAMGNVIDCIFYGVAFDAPAGYHEVAQLFPADGGYASLFNGRVVDMLHFPLFEWDWPTWMPWVGGDHCQFFRPVFNIADAALSVSVVVLILFYSKHLVSSKKASNDDNNNSDTQPETEQ